MISPRQPFPRSSSQTALRLNLKPKAKGLDSWSRTTSFVSFSTDASRIYKKRKIKVFISDKLSDNSTKKIIRGQEENLEKEFPLLLQSQLLSPISLYDWFLSLEPILKRTCSRDKFQNLETFLEKTSNQTNWKVATGFGVGRESPAKSIPILPKQTTNNIKSRHFFKDGNRNLQRFLLKLIKKFTLSTFLETYGRYSKLKQLVAHVKRGIPVSHRRLRRKETFTPFQKHKRHRRMPPIQKQYRKDRKLIAKWCQDGGPWVSLSTSEIQHLSLDEIRYALIQKLEATLVEEAKVKNRFDKIKKKYVTRRFLKEFKSGRAQYKSQVREMSRKLLGWKADQLGFQYEFFSRMKAKGASASTPLTSGLDLFLKAQTLSRFGFKRSILRSLLLKPTNEILRSQEISRFRKISSFYQNIKEANLDSKYLVFQELQTFKKPKQQISTSQSYLYPNALTNESLKKLGVLTCSQYQRPKLPKFFPVPAISEIRTLNSGLEGEFDFGMGKKLKGKKFPFSPLDLRLPIVPVAMSLKRISKRLQYFHKDPVEELLECIFRSISLHNCRVYLKKQKKKEKWKEKKEKRAKKKRIAKRTRRPFPIYRGIRRRRTRWQFGKTTPSPYPDYAITLRQTFNNNFIHFSDIQKGNDLFKVSAGRVGFRNTRKRTRYALQSTIDTFVKKLKAYTWKLKVRARKSSRLSHGIFKRKPIVIRMKGRSFLRKHLIKALVKLRHQRFILRDITGVPYNGCRGKKPKRKKRKKRK